MIIDSDYVKQMATQLANFEVQGALMQLDRNEARYKSERDALSKLRTALTTFNSKIKGLSGTTSSMLVNKASFSQEGYATASVGSKAVAGTYQFHVEKLASAHQVALKAADFGQTGTLTIGQGSESFEIDLGAVIDADDGDLEALEKLAAAINDKEDNTGVKAAVLRQGAETYLILTSEESGADHALSLDIDGNDLADQWTELSEAQDAEIHVGQKDSGIVLRSSTNRFDNIIDGVSLTFTKAHEAGEAPLTVTIGRDDSATRGKVQTFVDAFNALVDSINALTASGDENSARGPLAGNASVRSIEDRLNRLLRDSFGITTTKLSENNQDRPVTLAALGIVANRDGKLSIDTARFEAAIAKAPEVLDQLFGGKGNLLDSIDKTLSSYTSNANGVLTNRMETLDQNLRRMNEQFERIQRQYDNYYARYLKQFTMMMQTMQSMEQTHGMF